MQQFFGLLLLIAAISVLFYVSNHPELIKFDIPVSRTVRISTPTPPTTPSYLDTTVPKEIPILQTSKTVRISAIRQPSSYAPYLEVSLYSNLNNGEIIDITGWTIKSNYGSFTIPRAQERYSFGGQENGINFRFGDRVYLYSGFGPKGSFRLNKCMGYIEDRAPFTPPVPRNCPYISRSEINNLSGLCQDYILSLKSCENPSSNPPIKIDDIACHNFLSKLNYTGCVEKYGQEQDFLSSEWRLWIGEQMNIFDPRHDRVQLLDIKGQVVDEYSY
ncbi:MAG: hypothetical protein HZB99_01050 [Candidatus Harrisonbacteria bacterium]|nr:hypothetical protein [Candidatus Harrisonbacteria bacterium]